MCAYSHTAALCNYSFLVRYARSSKSPICTWKKYTLITPSGMTDAVYPACMHAVSAICLWATVLVYNRSSSMKGSSEFGTTSSAVCSSTTISSPAALASALSYSSGGTCWCCRCMRMACYCAYAGGTRTCLNCFTALAPPAPRNTLSMLGPDPGPM